MSYDYMQLLEPLTLHFYFIYITISTTEMSLDDCTSNELGSAVSYIGDSILYLLIEPASETVQYFIFEGMLCFFLRY